MNCKECDFFKPTYPESGYCEFWDIYTKENDSCEDGEEKE